MIERKPHKELARIGELEERVAGKERLFIHVRLMQLLTRDTNSLNPYFP